MVLWHWCGPSTVLVTMLTLSAAPGSIIGEFNAELHEWNAAAGAIRRDEYKKYEI